jgi:hypothetical protein
MNIDVEGAITVKPDGSIEVTGFSITGGTMDDLLQLAKQRVLLAATRLENES